MYIMYSSQTSLIALHWRPFRIPHLFQAMACLTMGYTPETSMGCVGVQSHIVFDDDFL